jgi:hypothetical protein
MTVIKQTFQTEDGKVFATKKEALDYLRRPKIKAALQKVAPDNADLVDWLLENQEKVEMSFEVGTIRRVTKVERNKLEKALKHMADEYGSDNKLSFLVDNLGAIAESFRWPSVARMDEDEKRVAARNSLVLAAEGNEKLAEWIMANKDAVLSAYEAGIEKRQINPKAAEALAVYRAQKAAEKAAAEAAAAAG